MTCEEARAHLGFETQRQWSDKANARTSPVLLALYSLVTLLALQLSQGWQIPVPVTTWYHKAEPTFADCLALVRQHLWRAQYLVNSTAEPDFMQFPREAFERLLTGLPLTASLAKVESYRPLGYTEGIVSTTLLVCDALWYPLE